MKKKPLKQKSVRMNVTVPPDVKKRMDKTKEDVNWSAVATQAFIKKLGEIAASKEKKNMSDVINRLRASKQSSETEAYEEGVSHGKSWAEGHALAVELQRLEAYQETFLGEAYGMFDGEPMAPWGHAEYLAFEILKGDRDQAVSDDFWGTALSTGRISDWSVELTDVSFLEGFVDGAIAVWNEVKHKL